MLADEQPAFPYAFHLYHKEESVSKIDLSIDLLRQAPDLQRPTYVLCDSWYTSKTMIETYLQQVKGHFGFEGVQVRSKRAISRYWLLVQFTYLFLCDLCCTVFTQTIHLVRKQKFASIIEFLHTATANGASLEQIKNELQVA